MITIVNILKILWMNSGFNKNSRMTKICLYVFVVVAANLHEAIEAEARLVGGVRVYWEFFTKLLAEPPLGVI